MTSRASRSSPYPIDLIEKDVRTGMYDAFVFDADGIPMYPYSTGTEYNITFVCHYALCEIARFQENQKKENLDRFLLMANWIAENGHSTPIGFVFYYRHPLPGLSAPWISALGQGRMISVFTRAYQETGMNRYLELAESALKPFTVPVTEGGIQARFPGAGFGFEEYPKHTPTLVLNGMITSLFGLHDLAEVGSSSAKVLFEESYLSLLRNLSQYDLGFATRYDLSGPVPLVASWDYHQYHILQLYALFKLTGNEEFQSWALRWEKYEQGIRWHVVRNASRIYYRLKRMVSTS